MQKTPPTLLLLQLELTRTVPVLTALSQDTSRCLQTVAACTAATTLSTTMHRRSTAGCYAPAAQQREPKDHHNTNSQPARRQAPTTYVLPHTLTMLHHMHQAPPQALASQRTLQLQRAACCRALRGWLPAFAAAAAAAAYSAATPSSWLSALAWISIAR
jgi:hypothetical protein